MTDSLLPVWDETTKRWSDDAPVTDDEKHAFCQRRTGTHAAIISPAQYAAFEAEGVDMRWYVVTKPIPVIDPDVRLASNINYQGGASYPRFAASSKRPWSCPGEKR